VNRTKTRWLFFKGHYQTLLPVVAQMSGADLVKIVGAAGAANPPPLAMTALVKSTRDTHRRMLAWIDAMPLHLQHMSAAAAILHC
jgi:hypothetical protein